MTPEIGLDAMGLDSSSGSNQPIMVRNEHF